MTIQTIKIFKQRLDITSSEFRESRMIVTHAFCHIDGKPTNRATLKINTGNAAPASTASADEGEELTLALAHDSGLELTEAE